MAGVVLPDQINDTNMKKDDLVFNLLNVYNKLIKELEFLLSHLDDKNITPESVTADSIRANTITANKMNVQQLSAIAADLGEITAGIIRGISIFGSYIATAEGTYPRSEMNLEGNFFAAYADVDTYLSIMPMGVGSVPTLILVDGGTTKAFLNRAAGGTTLGTFGSEPLNFQPGGGLQIDGVSGYNDTFSYVKDVVAGVPSYGSVTVKKGIITSVT